MILSLKINMQCIAGFIMLFFCSYSSVIAEQTIKIYADEINVDELDQRIVATGDAIAINENEIKIKSDKIIYNRKNKSLNAFGKVIINDESENTFFLDELSSSENLNKATGKSIKVRLHDGSRIVGESYKKENEISIIENTEYTPCAENNYLIKNCPGWKLKSKRIFHNNKTKTIHYDHAQIQLFNVPVFYLPYFSHPDPSVEKRSGFLMPTIQTDKQLGDTFSIPIFINLKSNKDLTFTPNIQTKKNNFYNLNYRHLNKTLKLDLNASIDDNDDDSGTSNHLFFDSEIFNPYGTLNAYMKTSNNDTYMRKNKINKLTVLKSGFDFERETDKIFFSAESIGYKHLTAQDRQWEYLYPSLVYNINDIENNLYEGNISLNNTFSFRKNLNETYETIASSQLDWSNQSIHRNSGFMTKNEANLRITSISIDEKSKKNSNNLRLYPQVSSKISFPLMKTSSLTNQTLTPLVMPIIAPFNNYTPSKAVTNSNLFSSNRATSITEWESGPRINYGLEWFINSTNGINVMTIIGQSYRFNKDNINTDKEISDYFFDSNIILNSNNYLNSSLVIDRDDLKTKSLSTNSFNMFGDLIFAINYDYTSGKYDNPSEQIALGGKYNFKRNLFIKFTGSKNLDTNKNIGYQYGILYENDCLGIDFNYYKDLTKDRDVEESDGFSFTVVLKPFGSTNNYGKNKVFGPQI